MPSHSNREILDFFVENPELDMSQLSVRLNTSQRDIKAALLTEGVALATIEARSPSKRKSKAHRIATYIGPELYALKTRLIPRGYDTQIVKVFLHHFLHMLDKVPESERPEIIAAFITENIRLTDIPSVKVTFPDKVIERLSDHE